LLAKHHPGLPREGNGLSPRWFYRSNKENSIQAESVQACGIGRAVIWEKLNRVPILEQNELTPVVLEQSVELPIERVLFFLQSHRLILS